MNFRTAIAGLIIVAGLAGTASAQTPVAPPPKANPGSGATGPEQVKGYLDMAKDTMTKRGFARCRPYWIKGVPKGQSAIYSVSMTPGKACEVAARCDNDCNDIDVWVNNPKGVLIGQNVSLSDEEHMAFVPAMRGQYKFKIEMPGCNAQNQCTGGLVLCCQR